MSRRFSVLLVHDEREVLDPLHAALRTEFEVAVASTTETALRLAGKSQFDAVCTEFRMPRMTGLQLLEKLQRISSSGFGVVLVSPLDYPEYQARVGNVRALALLKPFSQQRALEMLRRASSIGRMRRSTADAQREVLLLSGREDEP